MKSDPWIPMDDTCAQDEDLVQVVKLRKHLGLK